MSPDHAPFRRPPADPPASEPDQSQPVGPTKPRIEPARATFSFAITPELRAWSQAGTSGRHRADAAVPRGATAWDPVKLPFPRWKRAIDLAACFVALPILGLCTLVMFLLTKRFSPGPILYQQERIGRLGRRFRIYKFRTMKVGADCSIHREYCRELIHSNAPMAKLDSRGDARLIPLAWVLRASGLDELPQLINVLRGEMSLVGPRPCLPAEFAHYESWQRRRCDARPGLTGLWQVSGKNRTTFDQMIRLDLQYVRDLSLWLDLKVIILTVPCLLGQVREGLRARRSPPAPGRQHRAETPA